MGICDNSHGCLVSGFPTLWVWTVDEALWEPPPSPLTAKTLPNLATLSETANPGSNPQGFYSSTLETVSLESQRRTLVFECVPDSACACISCGMEA